MKGQETETGQSGPALPLTQSGIVERLSISWLGGNYSGAKQKTYFTIF
jgi:hypothetical protein